MLKDKIVSELLAHKDSGVMKIDDDYQLDSLVKLEVVSFLEKMKTGFLESRFSEVAMAATLDEILGVFDSYQVASAA